MCDNDGDGWADILVYFGEYIGMGMEIYKGYFYCFFIMEVFCYLLLEDGVFVLDENSCEFVVSGFL